MPGTRKYAGQNPFDQVSFITVALVFRGALHCDPKLTDNLSTPER